MKHLIFFFIIILLSSCSNEVPKNIKIKVKDGDFTEKKISIEIYKLTLEKLGYNKKDVLEILETSVMYSDFYVENKYSYKFNEEGSVLFYSEEDDVIIVRINASVTNYFNNRVGIVSFIYFNKNGEVIYENNSPKILTGKDQL